MKKRDRKRENKKISKKLSTVLRRHFSKSDYYKNRNI